MEEGDRYTLGLLLELRELAKEASDSSSEFRRQVSPAFANGLQSERPRALQGPALQSQKFCGGLGGRAPNNIPQRKHRDRACGLRGGQEALPNGSVGAAMGKLGR